MPSDAESEAADTCLGPRGAFRAAEARGEQGLTGCPAEAKPGSRGQPLPRPSRRIRGSFPPSRRRALPACHRRSLNLGGPSSLGDCRGVQNSTAPACGDTAPGTVTAQSSGPPSEHGASQRPAGPAAPPGPRPPEAPLSTPPCPPAPLQRQGPRYAGSEHLHA